MKVTFPKNIKKWLLSWFSINIWPLSITIVQLLLVAVWVWIALAIFSKLKDNWTAWALIASVPILIIFLVLAFFKISEMWMLEYLAKIFRNKFFDVQKKFQVNFERNNDTEIAIKESKINESKAQTVEYKKENFEAGEKIVEQIEKWDLI